MVDAADMERVNQELVAAIDHSEACHEAFQEALDRLNREAAEASDDRRRLLLEQLKAAEQRLHDAMEAVHNIGMRPDAMLAQFAARLHHQYALLFERTKNGCYPWAMYGLCRRLRADIPDWVFDYFDRCSAAVEVGYHGRVKPAEIAKSLGLAKGGGGDSIWTQRQTWDRNYHLAQQVLMEMVDQSRKRHSGQPYDDDSQVFVTIAERYNRGDMAALFPSAGPDKLDPWYIRTIYYQFTEPHADSPAGRRWIAFPTIHRQPE